MSLVRRITVAFALITACSLLCLTSWYLSHRSVVSRGLDYSWMQNRIIAHALGGIGGDTYTNSLEALERSYGAGARVFEVDFDLTSDTPPIPIASHDEETWRKLSGVDDEAQYDAEVFLASRLGGGGYTPMTLYQLVDWFAAHPNCWLVIDRGYTREDARLKYSYLVSYANETDPSVLDRIIPEFNSTDYLAMLEDIYPFSSYILSIDSSGMSSLEAALFCRLNHINAIAIWYTEEVMSERLPFFKTLGIGCVIATVNDAALAEELFDAGVAAVYSDDFAEWNSQGLRYTQSL